MVDQTLGLRRPKPNGQAGASVVGVERTTIGSAADVRQQGIRETGTKAAAKQEVPGIPKFEDDPIGAVSFALREIGAQVFGPAPAPIARVRGRHRVRLLVKAEKSVPLQEALARWIGQLRLKGDMRVAVDIDPQSFY